MAIDTETKPTARALIREATKFVVLAATYWLYMKLAAPTVPTELALLTNGFLVPVLFGSIGYAVFHGNVFVRIILITGAASLVLLLIVGPGDPAKPKLHVFAAVTIAAMSFLGAATTAGITAILSKWRNRIR